MNLKLKLLIGIVYFICFSALMFVIFSNFDLKDLSDVNFFKNNQQLLNNLKSESIFLLIILFSIFSIIWILLLGFGTPLALLAGFIFDKWVGTLISVLSFSIGATLLYFLANFFFRDFLKKKRNSSSCDNKEKRYVFEFLICRQKYSTLDLSFSAAMGTLMD